jgi:hypothetical protein
VTSKRTGTRLVRHSSTARSKRRDGLRDVAAAPGHEPNASVAIDKAGRLIEVASDPDGLLAARHRLVELAQLGEAPGQAPEGGCPSRTHDA